jgi:hypothetical protein
MGPGRKLCHIGANFGQDGRRRFCFYARNGLKQSMCSLKGLDVDTAANFLVEDFNLAFQKV